jgi:hypothetical protein
MSRPYIAQATKDSSRVVLMADANGQLHYEKEAGPVDIRDVVRNYCLLKERERRLEGLSL